MAKGEAKGKKFIATIVELFNRAITLIDDKENKVKVYHNDDDNLYPNRVELIEKNSTTASSASNKLKSFIVGKGFEDQELNEYVFNESKKINGYRLLNKIANSVKTHKGAFIYVNYDVEGNVVAMDVLDFKKCRIGREDDKGNYGKIYYHNWENSGKKVFTKTGNKAVKWFYPFNSDIDIINDQRKNDAAERGDTSIEGLVKNYRGQVYFLNLDENEIYPYAWVHPAYNDADNEYRISLYRNNNLRTGFLGKTIVVANGIDKEDKDDFEEAVKGWMGAENSSSVMVVTLEDTVDNPSSVIHTIELNSNYDSKRFESDEISTANNIRKAYLSIPKILIDPEDSFFGSSGEAFKEAIKYYNSETLFVRENITYALEEILRTTDDLKTKNFTISELGAEELVTTTQEQ